MDDLIYLLKLELRIRTIVGITINLPQNGIVFNHCRTTETLYDQRERKRELQKSELCLTNIG